MGWCFGECGGVLSDGVAAERDGAALSNDSGGNADSPLGSEWLLLFSLLSLSLLPLGLALLSFVGLGPCGESAGDAEGDIDDGTEEPLRRLLSAPDSDSVPDSDEPRVLLGLRVTLCRRWCRRPSCAKSRLVRLLRARSRSDVMASRFLSLLLLYLSPLGPSSYSLLLRSLSLRSSPAAFFSSLLSPSLASPLSPRRVFPSGQKTPGKNKSRTSQGKAWSRAKPRGSSSDKRWWA